MTNWGRLGCLWVFSGVFFVLPILAGFPGANLVLASGDLEPSAEARSGSSFHWTSADKELSEISSRVGGSRVYLEDKGQLHLRPFDPEASVDAELHESLVERVMADGLEVSEPNPDDNASAAQENKALPAGFSSNSGVTPQALALPEGAGAMQGMGESFQPNLNTGAGTFSVPIILPPGRRGLQPQLGFSYSTGAGDGPIGWGWRLGVPFISRQSTKGLPRYDSTDRFVFNGGQELVQINMPADEEWPGGDWDPSNGYDIAYYRARIEGGFLRFFYNRSTNQWLVQDRQGNHFYYGENAGSQVAGHQGTYQWNLARIADVRRATGNAGNDVHYVYLNDGGTLHLRDVYWNSFQQEYSVLEHYQHNVHLEYEQRPDPSSSYVPGFLLERNLRLSRIEVSSHQIAPQGKRSLTRAYLLRYAPASESIHSRLAELQVCGSDWTVTGEGTCMEPLRMYYSAIAGLDATSATLSGFGQFNERAQSLVVSPNVALDNPNVSLMDVNQDGLPDVLMTLPEHEGSHHAAIINDGVGSLDPENALIRVDNPSGWSLRLENLNVSLMDMDGSGNADLLHMPYQQKYHFYRLRGKCDPDSPDCQWVSSADVPLNDGINFQSHAGDIRVVDLNNDSLVDIVRTTGTRMEHFLNLSSYPGFQGQFGRVNELGQPEAGEGLTSCVLHRGSPMQFSNGNLQFGDMNGDGLQDIVDLRSGSIAYWPGRGYGRFGDSDEECQAGELGTNLEIEIAGSPYFSNPDNEGIRIADVNGDGLADLVQLRVSSVDIWFNRGNNSFTERYIINDTPIVPSGKYASVRFADINGSGTVDIIWGNAGGWQYLDLAGDYRQQDWNGGYRAGLLEQIDNGLGGSTYIEYATTVEMMVDHREAGDPWETVAPMPLTVVRRTISTDHLEQVGGQASVYVQENVYRNPYFDGHESEFKGFSYGESWDRSVEAGLASCDAASLARGDAPVVTRHWFHRGIRPECAESPVTPQWGSDSEDCKNALHRDNPLLGLTGAVMKTELYSPCSGEIMGASLSQIEVIHLFEGISDDLSDDRAVWFVSPNQGFEYVYDPALTLTGDGKAEVHEAVRVVDNEGQNIFTQSETYTPASNDGTFHRLGGWNKVGLHGYPSEQHFNGFHKYSGASLYDFADCDQYSQYMEMAFDPQTWVHAEQNSYMVGPELSESGAPCVNHCTSARPCNWIQKTYSDAGDVAFGELRRSKTTYWDSPYDSGTSSKTLITDWREYNEFGQVTKERSGCLSESVSSCTRNTEYSYENEDDGDLNYSAFVRKETADVPDSLAEEFVFNATWDAGLAAMTYMKGADGQESLVEHDALGRVHRTFGSDPRTGLLCTQKPLKEYEYHYDTAPMPHLITRIDLSSDFCGEVPSGPTSHIIHTEEIYSWVDGLGRPYATVTTGDDHLAGESKYPWIISGTATLNAKGGLVEGCEPVPLSNQPTTPSEVIFAQKTAQTSLAAKMPGGQWNCIRKQYDAWGRLAVITAADGTMAKHEYGVDSTDTYDHLDLTDACHFGTYASERQDGFGRNVEVVNRHRGDCESSITENWTTMQYDALGNLEVLTRFEVAEGALPHTAAERFSSRYIYDSLGRLKENLDLNYGRWQYFYDELGQLIRTVAPAGGETTYDYDSAGRLLSETLGASVEPDVQYFYDVYPGNAVLGLDTAIGWTGYPTQYPSALGRLVAIKDRSGVTVVAADYGSKTETWRKIIKDDQLYHSETTVDGAGRLIYSEDADGHRFSASYYADGTMRGSFWTDELSDPQKYTLVGDSRTNMFGQKEWVRYGAVGQGELELWNGYDPVTHRTLATVVQNQTPGKTATLSAFGYQHNTLGMVTGIVDWRGRADDGSPDTDVQQLYLQNVNHPASMGHDIPGHHYPSFPVTFNAAMTAPATGAFNSTDWFSGYSTTGWPAGAAPSDVSYHFDSLNRLRSEDRSYASVNGVDGPVSSSGNLLGRRAEQISWDFDWLGSMTTWEEETGDQSIPVSAQSLGRALGELLNGRDLNLLTGCDSNALAASSVLPSNCYKPEAVYFAHNLDSVSSGRATCVWSSYDQGGRIASQHILTGCSSCGFEDGAGHMTASCGFRSVVGVPGQPDYQPEIAGTRTQYEYIWDEQGQLSQAEKHENSNHVLTMTYLYDARGSRVISEKSDTPGGIDQIRQDLHIGGGFERRQVQLQNSSGQPMSLHDAGAASGYKNIENTRLLKYASDVRIQYEESGGAMDMTAPKLFLPLANHLGSTTAVVDLADGTLVEWRANFAFGADESHWRNNASKYANAEEPYGFSGAEEDKDVGLHYFGDRFYSVYQARWLGPGKGQHEVGSSDNLFSYQGAVAQFANAAVDHIRASSQGGDSKNVNPTQAVAAGTSIDGSSWKQSSMAAPGRGQTSLFGGSSPTVSSFGLTSSAGAQAGLQRGRSSGHEGGNPSITATMGSRAQASGTSSSKTSDHANSNFDTVLSRRESMMSNRTVQSTFGIGVTSLVTGVVAPGSTKIQTDRSGHLLKVDNLVRLKAATSSETTSDFVQGGIRDRIAAIGTPASQQKKKATGLFLTSPKTGQKAEWGERPFGTDHTDEEGPVPNYLNNLMPISTNWSSFAHESSYYILWGQNDAMMWITQFIVTPAVWLATLPIDTLPGSGLLDGDATFVDVLDIFIPGASLIQRLFMLDDEQTVSVVAGVLTGGVSALIGWLF